MTTYPASDDFIMWLESLSGILTKIKTEYGTIAELVEHPDWDDNRIVEGIQESEGPAKPR